VYMGVKTAESPTFWHPRTKFPAQSIKSKLFQTVTHERKIPVESLNKTAVSSNGDVISTARRPLAATFTSVHLLLYKGEKITSVYE
jgi:hypothetical protein